MIVLLQLFTVLLLARLFGEAFHRLGQPGSVGEILAGVTTAVAVAILGPKVPYLADLKDAPAIAIAAQAGVFTLILLAGLEMEPQKIIRKSARSFVVALGGVAVPFCLGLAVAWLFLPPGPLWTAQALLVGLALSITAIPASVRVLEDLGIMQSDCARTILAAAVIDDVIGLVLLAFLVATLHAEGAPDLIELGQLALQVAAFFLISILFGQHIYPHIRRGVALLQALSVELSALVLGALAYGVLAELLGLHWILGPFMAGLFFEPERVGEEVYQEVRLAVSSLANGLLGPLFFFTIGLSLDPAAISAAPLFLIALILVAFAGKILGAGVPAYLMGLSRPDALAVGVGMCSRGAVELVVLSIALESGLFHDGSEGGPAPYIFSALVITAVVTTLATPPLLRWALRRTN